MIKYFNGLYFGIGIADYLGNRERSMTLMIKISRNGRCTAFTLIGRIDAKQVVELQTLFDAVENGEGIVVDLKEVQLVDPYGVRFLAGCEENGAQLKNCPEYIREWIEKARPQK